MSQHKELKARDFIQRHGIVHVNTDKSASSDIGFVGEYTSGASTAYAGLVRKHADGRYVLFDGLTANPFSSDSVNTAGAGFTLAALDMQEIRAGTAQLSTGALTTTSGDLNISAAGTLILNSATVAAAPTADLGVANKSYVDNLVKGFVAKAAVTVKTTGALDVTAAGAGAGKTLTANTNGAISAASSSFDGVALAVGDRVLVGSQTAQQDNGIYVVTTAGNAGAPYVLTRAADADETPSGELSNGAFVFVDDGDTLINTGWVLQGPFGSFAIDNATTGKQVWVKFSKDVPISYTIANLGTGAGTFKAMNGTEFDFRSLIATQTAGDAGLFSATQNANDITFNLDQSKITGVGVLASGSIATGFGSITTTQAIQGGSVTSTGPITLNATEGNNILQFPLGLTDAFQLYDGSNAYLKVDSALHKMTLFATHVDTELTFDAASSMNFGDTLEVRPLATVSNAFIKFDKTSLSTEFGEKTKLKSTVDQSADLSVISHSTLRARNAKNAARARTVGNLVATYDGTAGTLTGSQSMADQAALTDGVTLAVGDTLLVMAQTNASENGLYTVTDATTMVLTRAKDADTAAKLTLGSYVPVIEGTVHARSWWVLTSVVASLTATDPITFARVGAGNATVLTGASGENTVTMPDALADALSFLSTDGKSYLKFVTTNGSESLQFGQTVFANDGLDVVNGLNVDTIHWTGVSGANQIQLPTAMANALDFYDVTAGLSYLQFDTVAGSVKFSQPVALNALTLVDNQATALAIREGANNYLTFTTTDGQEKVVVAQALESTAGMKISVRAVSADTTLDASYHAVRAMGGASGITLTLPDAAANAGRVYKVLKVDAGVGAVTVAPGGSDLLDGENASLALPAQYDYASFTSYGASGWYLH